MRYQIDNFSYKKAWNNISVDSYGGYGPRMTDYHMHTYYEISLIKEGDVTVFLSDISDSGTHSRVVLTRPLTPHFIIAEPESFYSRTNVLFSNDFIAGAVPEWDTLSELFGANGNVISLTHAEHTFIFELISKLNGENDLFRKKLILLYILSVLKDVPANGRTSSQTPKYITAAVSYLTENFTRKITADELAATVGVGRTTLMTGFKKYMGVTMNEYVTGCRLKQAIKLLRAGSTIDEAAEKCGYADGSCLIRVFKKRFGVTPMEYLGRKLR